MRARKTSGRPRDRSHDGITDVSRERMIDRARAAYIDGDLELDEMEVQIASALSRPRVRSSGASAFYTRPTKRRTTSRK